MKTNVKLLMRVMRIKKEIRIKMMEKHATWHDVPIR